VDSLKVLDLKRPIREADVTLSNSEVRFAFKTGNLIWGGSWGGYAKLLGR
jgi:hypothetical protein